MPELKLGFKALTSLLPSEEHCATHASYLAEKIAKNKVWTHPLLVDKHTNVILDGHHRYSAAKTLKFTKIPCLMVDYNSPLIRVTSWETGENMDKSKVISKALSGKLFMKKSTRHELNFMIPIEYELPIELLSGAIS
ncbi:ParB N-terminal domain-containing protein [Pseudoalteromonas holothuriae]|uniref:ParB N-terminal domain-containing protein n=1 Tax=Pseudoalteromonas holothuriae TaxID=2963714 RepID=UPI0021C1D3B4|nr:MULTISPECIES: ParB N-terminal domain-containing protein [unclassified Pseudoalteromonas]